jgi:hypothetical protein
VAIITARNPRSEGERSPEDQVNMGDIIVNRGTEMAAYVIERAKWIERADLLPVANPMSEEMRGNGSERITGSGIWKTTRRARDSSI